MIMGYNDDGRRPKLCHMPLRALIIDRVGTGNRYTGGCLKDWPYSRGTGNGHRPFGLTMIWMEGTRCMSDDREIDHLCESCEESDHETGQHCEGCDCCQECCDCTPSDCDCDACLERRENS